MATAKTSRRGSVHGAPCCRTVCSMSMGAPPCSRARPRASCHLARRQRWRVLWHYPTSGDVPPGQRRLRRRSVNHKGPGRGARVTTRRSFWARRGNTRTRGAPRWSTLDSGRGALSCATRRGWRPRDVYACHVGAHGMSASARRRLAGCLRMARRLPHHHYSLRLNSSTYTRPRLDRD